MQRFLVVATGAIVAAVLGAGCGGDDSGGNGGGEGDPIRIGLVTSTTGDLAATGRQVQSGVEQAVADWNDEGGNVELISEDDRSTPEGAINAYNKVVAEDPVAVVGPTFTPLMLALAPAIQAAETPTLTSAIGAPVTDPETSGGWIFRVSTEDVEAAAALGRYVTSELKPERPAILYANNDYGAGGYEGMDGVFKDAGIDWVAVEKFTEGDKDFSAQLQKVSQADADLLVVWAIPTDGGLVQTQIGQSGLDIPIVGSPGYATPEFLELAGDSANGAYSAIISLAGQDASSREWTERVEASHPDVPVSFTVSTSYDAATMVLEQLEDDPAADGTQVRDLLAGVDGYEGVSGEFSCDTDGNCFHQAIVVQWEDEELVPLKTEGE